MGSDRPRRKSVSNVFWAIARGDDDFYTGTWLTRNEAIKAHVEALDGIPCHDTTGLYDIRNLTREQQSAWRRRRKNGDYAIKVNVSRI